MFSYDICVVGGAGHVGLPLSIAFADKGKKVAIYDIDSSALAKIGKGQMPFREEGASELLRKVIDRTLFVSGSKQAVAESKFVIVTIGTPVDEHLNPSFHSMDVFFRETLGQLSRGQVIVLRSTVFPGTTQRLQRIIKRRNAQVEVVFCCERILEGKALTELYTLPQIIAGFDEKAIEEVSALFRLLTPEIVVTGAVEAELTKLFTNSWRYMQFAAANQFYMIAEEYGANFYEIYRAMTFHYPRTSTFPKPGFAAGPCLFKDTMQLSAFSKNTFFLGHSAMLINEGLPNFIAGQIKKRGRLDDLTVGILGMAFKAESDDKRESLSYKLKKIMELEAKLVLCSDPYIEGEGFVSPEKLIELSDIIIIGAPHKLYRTLRYAGKDVVDVWNHLDAASVDGHGVVE
jgi:UDP-N-acetyl-D-mannosaminuronic acid dehydrogenase